LECDDIFIALALGGISAERSSKNSENIAENKNSEDIAAKLTAWFSTLQKK